MDQEQMRAQLKQYSEAEMRDAPGAYDRLDALVREAEEDAGFDMEEPLRNASGFRLFWRKGMRRRMAWYIVPMLEQQRMKNERTAQILAEMRDLLKSMDRTGGPE